MMINQTEDQLSFLAYTCGFHKFIHTIPLHQIFQNLKLLFLLTADSIPERVWKDQQIVFFQFSHFHHSPAALPAKSDALHTS